MKALAIFIALTMVALVCTSCSRDVGECWVPDGQGSGGGPIVPIGQGGFGEEPESAEGPVGKLPCREGSVRPAKKLWASWLVRCTYHGEWDDIDDETYNGDHQWERDCTGLSDDECCNDAVEKESVGEEHVPEWDQTDWFCGFEQWQCN